LKDLFEIIYEDNDLLVINKPAGLVGHPTKGDEFSSLISRVHLHLGNGASPHLVNRLDRETSGVTIVAKKRRKSRRIRSLVGNARCGKEPLHATITAKPAIFKSM
jgi:23S rRNA-/tRNA-specific pseudouridylate synthase